MQHSGFDVKSTFDCDRKRQTEMIKRHYSDYSEDQYVLWIVADLFHNRVTKDILCSVDIKSKTGKVYNIGNLNKSFADMNISTILRTPYPNKFIHHHLLIQILLS